MGERERDVRSVRFAELLEGSADPKGHTHTHLKLLALHLNPKSVHV